HAPHTGSDIIRWTRLLVIWRFQSTLPIQGATRIGQNEHTIGLFQSTLPIQGATEDSIGIFNELFISIHAPHTGSDSGCLWILHFKALFQSTLPIQGATVYCLASAS